MTNTMRTVTRINDLSFCETDIDHINGEDICSITTSDRKVKNLLAKLQSQHPDEVVPMAFNQDGSVWYHLPWDYIKIVPPRKLNISEERRKELSDRMRILRGNEE